MARPCSSTFSKSQRCMTAKRALFWETFLFSWTNLTNHDIGHSTNPIIKFKSLKRCEEYMSYLDPDKLPFFHAS